MADKGKEIAEKWLGENQAKGDVSSDTGVNPPVLPTVVSPPVEAAGASGGRDESTVFVSEALEGQKLLGQELATIFKDNNVHPILIFGSKGSGKTSLLASLFGYIQQSDLAAATLALRDDIFPSQNPQWTAHIAWARQLFHRIVLDFIGHKAPRSTSEESPFFVPVKLTLTTGDEASFAFLEGRGEWYMPDHNSDIPYKPFHALLEGLLQHYNGSATAIFIAPYTSGGYAPRHGGAEPSNSLDLRNSDLGLLGAINEYLGLRRAALHKDNFIVLMTKWDVFCEGISGDSFINPSGQEIQDALKQRFELSWVRFQNLNIVGTQQNKLFSVYCSGVIDGLVVIKPPQDDIDVINRYPRKLWNWLYTNNTGSPLYPDVLPRPEGILDRLIRVIRG